jgi:hypothetical protein
MANKMLAANEPLSERGTSSAAAQHESESRGASTYVPGPRLSTIEPHKGAVAYSPITEPTAMILVWLIERPSVRRRLGPKRGKVKIDPAVKLEAIWL